MSKFSINDFVLHKQKSQKITMITAYDFSHAQLIEQSAIDIILVGDSLGMVFQGKDNTLGVTIDDMIYHSKAVKKVLPISLLLVICHF